MDTRKIIAQLKRAEKAKLSFDMALENLSALLKDHADFDLIVDYIPGDGFVVMDHDDYMPTGEGVESVIDRLAKTGKIKLDELERRL